MAGARFARASERKERQGALLLQGGQMEPGRAKNPQRRILPIDPAGVMVETLRLKRERALISNPSPHLRQLRRASVRRFPVR